MERLAFLDHVTGLPNRRFVEMSLQTALSEFHSHKDPFGVLVIDLDRFKAINDRHGHAIGDLALKRVAMTLVGCCGLPILWGVGAATSSLQLFTM